MAAPLPPTAVSSMKTTTSSAFSQPVAHARLDGTAHMTRRRALCYVIIREAHTPQKIESETRVSCEKLPALTPHTPPLASCSNSEHAPHRPRDDVPRARGAQLLAAPARAAGARLLGGGAAGLDVAGAQAALRRADAVCFDVDSTVITEEGIDVLAEHCGAGAKVAEWTRARWAATSSSRTRSRRGSSSSSRARRRRRRLAAHPPTLTPGVADVIGRLRARARRRGVPRLGRLPGSIEPVADMLSIPHDAHRANTIEFGAARRVRARARATRARARAAREHASRARAGSPRAMRVAQGRRRTAPARS